MTKRFRVLLVSTVALVFLSSCGGESGNGSPGPEYANPLIQNDSFFTGSHWNDPHVLCRDGQFIMYASSDLAWNGHVSIYRLVSSDGVNWSLNPITPVLEKSSSGWDSHCVETPAVVCYQYRYHLFYTGYDVPFDYESDGTDGISGTADDDFAAKHFKIGHAVSSDGISFTKLGYVVAPTSPYTEPNLDFHQQVTGEPGPVVFQDKICLYFTALGAATEVMASWQTIGLITYDGSGWDTPRRVLTPDLALYPRAAYVGYSTPNAVVIGDGVHLYFDVVLESPWTQVKIHHAASADGETGWTQDSRPLLGREDYAWTAAEIRSPSALLHDNLLYLYFAGDIRTTSIDLAIGLEIYELDSSMPRRHTRR